MRFFERSLALYSHMCMNIMWTRKKNKQNICNKQFIHLTQFSWNKILSWGLIRLTASQIHYYLFWIVHAMGTALYIYIYIFRVPRQSLLLAREWIFSHFEAHWRHKCIYDILQDHGTSIGRQMVNWKTLMYCIMKKKRRKFPSPRRINEDQTFTAHS